MSLVNKNAVRSLKEGISKRLKQGPVPPDLMSAMKIAVAAALKK